MSAGRPILKTSLPSMHAASAASTGPSKPAAPRRAPPSAPGSQSQQQTGFLPNRPDADPRHVAIALHHAHQIQAQKDTETLILDRILELVTLPSSPSADPAAPSPEDARAFKSALVPFQPADYDNLLLERKIEGLCGYGLCPRPHRQEDARGTYRITWGAKGSGPGGRGRDMNIVPKEKLEMWCSDECAERAMYIRVQLAEEPVWERRADDARGQDLLLLEEGRARSQQGKGKGKMRSSATSSSDMANDIARLSVRDDNRSRELALERGDAHPALYTGRVGINVQENYNAQGPATAPQMRPGDETGGSIEGYVPQDR
ncbi:hypothetical protein BO70DRAFT_341706 [Aspergillus heteromorphus CBS 117.55]|uniref:RNA polymerase II subunit B1 CTD phosphatase RPAP2 homolog n=1 Tax=Aspergillus heteromorphus CBS 117.55 TaxID=1448321 RepID=A0A317VH47_9EURO|nr:uncharacterized protein BO70DRAFT_341706 [Aspergillus heteromorphus CBS 117.55]PWY73686.1 hypothetical protein BO70DRAFT_341706 [Aspergillus heteromorphus CBS 117.55]